MDEIINKVAGSGLVTVDPEAFFTPGERVEFDLAPQLYQGQILREKEFREFIKSNVWEGYRGKIVRVTCTTDAIVPAWAYMLLVIALNPFTPYVYFATEDELESILFAEKVAQLDVSPYRDARVVIKGCSNNRIPLNAYLMLASKLLPVTRSIMFGEPCSTVPLYKRKA
jgi:hypothetical protein